MDIKIEKNVPMPERNLPYRQAEWPEEELIETITAMDIGDSFVADIKYRNWLYLCMQRYRFSGREPKLKIYTTKESGETIRVFRISDEGSNYENE